MCTHVCLWLLCCLITNVIKATDHKSFCNSNEVYFFLVSYKLKKCVVTVQVRNFRQGIRSQCNGETKGGIGKCFICWYKGTLPHISNHQFCSAPKLLHQFRIIFHRIPKAFQKEQKCGFMMSGDRSFVVCVTKKLVLF